MGFLREERRAAGRAIVRAARRVRDAALRPPPLPRPDGLPPRILVIRPYFLGDIVLGLPVAQALKRARPDARITWLCREEWVPLLRGHAAVDEVLAWPREGSREWPAFLRRVRGRFDLVLSLAWDRATPWVALATGAPLRIGIEEFGRPRLVSLLHTHTVVAPERGSDRRPMADFYFEPLRQMGFGPRDEVPRLLPTPEEACEVEERVREGLGVEEGFLLIHPGGRLRNKRWPTGRFAEVLRHLDSLTVGQAAPIALAPSPLGERGGVRGPPVGQARRLPPSAGRAGSPSAAPEDGNRSGCPTGNPRTAPGVVLVCGPGEERWAADLARDLPSGKGIFWPAPKLGEFIALAKRARAFLGNDSGPMHMAAAAGCRVVAVFGGDPCRWGPSGEGHRVVAGSGGIESVTVEAVANAVREAMKAEEFREPTETRPAR